MADPAATSTSPEATAPPDWSQTTTEALCPLCEYNLRGLTEARCPECGYRFAWADVLDSNRRLHPYLFEHHPEANTWSYARTTLAGFRPIRFWRLLHPAQPSRLRRLAIFALVGHTVYILAICLTCCAMIYDIVRLQEQQHRDSMASVTLSFELLSRDQQQAILGIYGSAEAYIAARVGRPRDLWDAYHEIMYDWRGKPTGFVVLLASMSPLLWPWLTFGALWGVWQPTAKVRITPAHQLRCALYSFDFPSWGGMAILCLTAVGLSFKTGWEFKRFLEDVGTWLLLAFTAIGLLRFYLGCRIYLRARWPLPLALGAQILAFIVFFAIGALFAETAKAWWASS